MKRLVQLLFLLWRPSAIPGHDDTLRAGKDADDHQMQSHHWNSLLL